MNQHATQKPNKHDQITHVMASFEDDLSDEQGSLLPQHHGDVGADGRNARGLAKRSSKEHGGPSVFEQIWEAFTGTTTNRVLSIVFLACLIYALSMFGSSVFRRQGVASK